MDLAEIWYRGLMLGANFYYCILIEIPNEFFDLIGWEAVRT